MIIEEYRPIDYLQDGTLLFSFIDKLRKAPRQIFVLIQEAVYVRAKFAEWKQLKLLLYHRSGTIKSAHIGNQKIIGFD